jgi:hypothetical protein
MDARSVRNGNGTFLGLPMAKDAKQGHCLDDTLKERYHENKHRTSHTHNRNTCPLCVAAGRACVRLGND